MKKEQHFQSTTLSTQSKGTKRNPYRKPDSIKYLELLAFEAKKEKFSSKPAEYLAPVKYRDDCANGIMRCNIDFLRTKGHQAERISTTGRIIDNTKTITDILGRQRVIGSVNWIKGNTTTGSADISATIKGWSVKIEVKIKDKQSQAQKDYERSIIQAGGLYYIARNFSRFIAWYNLNFAQ
jgi:hypothetical protein